MDEGIGPGRWQDDLYDLLRRNNVTQFAYVPDAGHRILIDRSLADPEVHSAALTSEEEGVAMLAGADLGGARGVLLMQSSGTGNCVNMLSLIKGGRFPFLTLVSMRGDFGEGNPWQFPMGQAVQPVLEGNGRNLPADRAARGGCAKRQRRLDDGVSERSGGGCAADPKAAGGKAILTAFRRRTLTHQALRAWSPLSRTAQGCSGKV